MQGQLIHLCTLVLPGTETRDDDNQVTYAPGAEIVGVQCRFSDVSRSELYSAQQAGVEAANGTIIFGRKTTIPDEATIKDVTDRRGDPVASGAFRFLDRAIRRTSASALQSARLRKIG